MGLLDWIRAGRNRAASDKACAEPMLDPEDHGHASIHDLFAEIRHDEALAKARDKTGREPEVGNTGKREGRNRRSSR